MPAENTKSAAKPITFPYKTLEAATKDHFKKIGGPEKAFAFLVKGFKTVAWRKRTETSARVREEGDLED
jgi:hypothetical protein